MTRAITVVRREVQVVQIDTINPNPVLQAAANVSYDNTNSGLAAENVKLALDELQLEKYNPLDAAHRLVLDNTTASYTETDRNLINNLGMIDHSVYTTNNTAVQTGVGLRTAGNFGNVNTVSLELQDLAASAEDMTNSDKLVVINSSGGQTKRSITTLPQSGGMRPVGIVTPTGGTNSTTMDIIVGLGVGQTIDAAFPPLETLAKPNRDGFFYTVRLTAAQKQTGVLSSIALDENSDPVLLYDQDQIVWVSSNANDDGQGEWIHLETGDVILGFNGRVGVIEPTEDDYTSDLIKMQDTNGTADSRILGLEAVLTTTPIHTVAASAPTTTKAGDTWTNSNDDSYHVYINGAFVQLTP